MEIKSNSHKRSYYLEDRRNFMKVTSLGFAALYGLALLWMFGDYGGIGWWFFLVVLALVAGRVGAFFMWFVFKSVYGIDEPKDDARKP